MGNPFVSDPSLGLLSALNITVPVMLAATPSFVATVIVLAAGTTTGAINDCSFLGAARPNNLVFTIPTILGANALRIKCDYGIVVTPGAGQVLAVWFSK